MSDRPVWIDLANSPHVIFFKPVIDELHRRGVATVVSGRDFAQTVGLARLMGIDMQVIGAHGGAGMVGKGKDLAGRVLALRAFARQKRPGVAVSHNSYAQALAGRSLRLPVVTAMDYEFQPANHLAFRCASLVVVPDVYPLDVLKKQGAPAPKVWRYSGLKEEIALAGFHPDPAYLSRTGVDTAKTVIVVRPPADMALYHRFENPLFPRLLEKLQSDPSLAVILLPRTPKQAEALKEAGFADLVWQGEPLDGPQMIAGADAVISAGGSMNREAAVLGTPAFSIYAGKLAAIDRALVADGRLVLLRSEADIAALELVKKTSAAAPETSDRLLNGFVDRLLKLRR